MRSHVMPLRERKCLAQELFIALSFSFAFAFALACPFAKTFSGSFLGALIGAFFGSFLGAFGGEFSFAFVFARNVERRAIGELTFAFTLGVLGGAPIACGNDGNSVSYCWEEYCVRGCSLGVRLRSEARRGRTSRAAAGRLV